MNHRTGGLTAARTRFRARRDLLHGLFDSLRSLRVNCREKDEAPAQPTLEDLLQRETEDEDALSLADFDDEQ